MTWVSILGDGMNSEMEMKKDEHTWRAMVFSFISITMAFRCPHDVYVKYYYCSDKRNEVWRKRLDVITFRWQLIMGKIIQGKALKDGEQWRKDGTLSNANIKSREKNWIGKGKRNCKKKEEHQGNLIYMYYSSSTMVCIKEHNKNWETLFPLFNHPHLNEGFFPPLTGLGKAEKTGQYLFLCFLSQPAPIPSWIIQSKGISKLLPSPVHVQSMDTWAETRAAIGYYCILFIGLYTALMKHHFASK